MNYSIIKKFQNMKCKSMVDYQKKCKFKKITVKKIVKKFLTLLISYPTKDLTKKIWFNSLNSNPKRSKINKSIKTNLPKRKFWCTKFIESWKMIRKQSLIYSKHTMNPPINLPERRWFVACYKHTNKKKQYFFFK